MIGSYYHVTLLTSLLIHDIHVSCIEVYCIVKDYRPKTCQERNCMDSLLENSLKNKLSKRFAKDF